MKQVKMLAVLLFLSIFFADPVLAQDPIVYPAQGQSQDHRGIRSHRKCPAVRERMIEEVDCHRSEERFSRNAETATLSRMPSSA